ncbi:MAG TPA: BON domain-containing protein [Gammaproteobacteria bacterium]|nr:BON domain-containing protein [Gammaproteobacteria bacterium]
MTTAAQRFKRGTHNHHRGLRLVLIAGLAVATISTSGCIATAVGVASITSIDIASDRRTAGNFVDDNKVELKIATELKLDDTLRQAKVHISATAINGIVLLTGEAPSNELRQRAVQIARGFPEASKVINQIRIAQSSGIGSRTNDTWITGKVKAAMLSASNLSATNIKVVTEASVVYLMGLVTRVEGNAAAKAATSVSGVTRVVKVFEYIQRQ